MPTYILSPEDRERLSTIPPEIRDDELVRDFTVSPEYLALVDQRVTPYRPPPYGR